MTLCLAQSRVRGAVSCPVGPLKVKIGSKDIKAGVRMLLQDLPRTPLFLSGAGSQGREKTASAACLIFSSVPLISPLPRRSNMSHVSAELVLSNSSICQGLRWH